LANNRVRINFNTAYYLRLTQHRSIELLLYKWVTQRCLIELLRLVTQ